MSLPRVPPRWRPVAWFAALFLIVETLTRVALRTVAGASVPHGLEDVRILATGFGYDLVTLLYVGLPLVLLAALVPSRGRLSRISRMAVEALCVLLIAWLLFVAASEWVFWQEFQTRFNFIAVDYLVYTTEVVGNIRESYPIGSILTALAAITALIAAATRRWRRIDGDGTGLRARLLVPLVWIGLATLATACVRADMKEGGANAYANELAGNGIYEFFAAYRAASLDYDRFYRTMPDAEADAEVRRTVATPDATFLHATGIDRMIRNARPERRLNVVLISVESFSAEFSGTYGREESLTPELDRLTPQSLVFDRVYANGTRTVRGLEALSLSVPPTPGESIVKRPNNEGLFTLASVFNRHGYTSEFLYGGYGAFDNMNAFFGANGYAVRDRTIIPSNAIHHETIWGVADEDLYTMAMAQFDAAHATGRPFFAHVMTTSNHRPYTFPAGRGPWKQKTRIGAVRYTDWAIGDFIRRARTHPWFADTVFVITADHCASSAGKATLPAFRYHIPLWIYSPAHIAPGHFDSLVGQLDIPPTLLGLLGFDYPSRFYGVDVFEATPHRALIGTYELLGLLTDNRLVRLSPQHGVATLAPSMTSDLPQPEVAEDPALTRRAIALYEHASHGFKSGAMRDFAGTQVATQTPPASVADPTRSSVEAAH